MVVSRIRFVLVQSRDSLVDEAVHESGGAGTTALEPSP